MRTASILAATLLLAACSDTPAGVSVLSVVITAPKQTIAIGEAVQLTTVARDVNGVTVANARIAYAASPTSVLEVDGSGRVVGRAQGVGSITATSGGQTSQPFVITVTLP
jgi:hypothetical protein